jgi:hypothetical protein
LWTTFWVGCKQNPSKQNNPISKPQVHYEHCSLSLSDIPVNGNAWRLHSPYPPLCLCGFVLNSCWVAKLSFFFLQFFFIVVIVVVGVHCDIYKSSYNTSYLNSPSPSFSFISPPHSWNIFNRSHCSIYIQVYTVFTPYSPSYILSPHPTGNNLLPSCSPILWQKKNDIFVCLR